ncbi:MAG: alkaline phosphatase family protein [Gemmatimonadota bacterium]
MKRVVLVGLDGFDPRVAERLMAAGRLPALARLRSRGGYARLNTTAPAQTPVAWSTLAVGSNPGGHGIFDFLRRNPETYGPEVALHSYEQKSAFLPPRVVNSRRGRAVWERLGDAGVPSTVLRYPCTYPPDRIPGRMIGGVGVPDVRGSFGTATVWTAAVDTSEGEGERVVSIDDDRDRVRTFLPGPLRPGGDEVRLEVDIERIDPDRVVVHVHGRAVEVARDTWTEWTPVRFKVGVLQSTRGLVRFRLVGSGESFALYASPVNYDPEAPVFPISHPWEYAADLGRELGPYHTLGMAEDHGGLLNGWLSEEVFLGQAAEVFAERLAMLRLELDRLDEGLLVCVFDTPDRIQHMMWRFTEPEHPANQACGFEPHLAGAIDEHYATCDAVVEEVLERADDETLVLVASDHGFRSFRRQLDLNAWLRDEGLLVLGDGAGGRVGLDDVDWDRTRAWTVGLGGVWLNVRGREARGIVEPDDAPALRDRIARALAGLADPGTGATAVRRAWSRDELYRGPFADEAPDVVVGCGDGYRISSRSALGGVGAEPFSDNRKRWAGDHVMDPELVPGVLFANRALGSGSPGLVDVAPTILRALGVPVEAEMEGESLL